MTDTGDFVLAMAQPDPAQGCFEALRQMAYDLLDLKQFTIMTYDEDRGVAQRIYSDDPVPYPVGGEKPVLDNIWTETVLRGQQPFIGNNIEALAEVFPDWEKIQSLGLESCLNLPIVIGGSVMGTLNCLNGPGHFTPARVKAANQLKLPGAMVFLLARQRSGQTQ